MTLWWIGDVVLLAVILPVVVYLLSGVLGAARSIVPGVDEIATVAAAGLEGPRRHRATADDAGPGGRRRSQGSRTTAARWTSSSTTRRRGSRRWSSPRYPLPGWS